MTVAKINAAHPFIFKLVHNGKTKRLMLGSTPNFFSAVSMVTGKVPTEDLEKKANDSAGNIFFMVENGLIPCAFNHNGNTTKPCNTLASTTTSKYSPMPLR